MTFTSQVRCPILPYAQQASRIRKKKKVKKRRERRVPSIPVCSLLMIMVNCAFSWIHKEASKAKGEHDPNFPSSVLLAFLLQTSASCSLQWYARAIVARWLPSAAWRWRRQRFPYMFEFRQGTLLCRVIYYPSLPVSIPIWEPCARRG